MEVLYVSSALKEDDFNQFISEMKEQKNIYGMPIAANKFHNLIMKGLVENNCNIYAVTIRGLSRKTHKKIFWSGQKKEMNNGITFKYIFSINLPMVKYIFNFLSALVEFVKWIIYTKNEERVIIFDASYVTILPAVILVSRMFSINTIAIFADVYSYMIEVDVQNMISFFSKFMRKVARYCYDNTGKYIYLSSQMNEVVNKKDKPFYVMEGLVDSRSISEREYIKQSKIVFMYAGALKKEYGLELLINGFRKTINPNLELWVFGDGNYKSEIIQIHKNDKRIKYMGYKTNKDIISFEKEADFLINPRPTNGEFTKYSFPSKLMEYMASGTATITTKLATLPKEYEKYLILFEEETAEGIKKTIEETACWTENRKKAVGREAQLFVLNNKSEKKQALQILK